MLLSRNKYIFSVHVLCVGREHTSPLPGHVYLNTEALFYSDCLKGTWEHFGGCRKLARAFEVC